MIELIVEAENVAGSPGTGIDWAPNAGKKKKRKTEKRKQEEKRKKR